MPFEIITHHCKEPARLIPATYHSEKFAIEQARQFAREYGTIKAEVWIVGQAKPFYTIEKLED